MTAILTERVAGVFATKAVVLGLGLATTYLLARVLGPTGRGEYYLALLIPLTLTIFGQLGIPAGLTFLAGRGVPLDELRTTALMLALLLATACIVPALAARSLLMVTVAPGTSELSLTMAIAAVPFLFITAFAVAILLGRHAFRVTNLLSLVQAIVSLALLLILVATGRLVVDAAVAVYLIVSVGASVIAVLAAARLAPLRGLSLQPLGPLLRYSLRVYPGSVASFFSYRADVFLLSIILGSATAVGLYVIAVSLAELLFYIADSVATAFFPHVSAAEHSEADRQVSAVSRLTVLTTIVAALAMIPFVVVGILIALPEFTSSILPFLLLLPGIVSLSLSKVLSGYVSGIGRPGSVGRVAVSSLIVNVVANFVLIPSFGIAGAAVASTISYTFNAFLMVALTSRLAVVPPRSLMMPTLTDARRIVDTGGAIAARYFAR